MQKEGVIYQTKILWAQIDSNNHLRHSAYGDIAATARMEMIIQAGMSFQKLRELQLGPVLFREELLYKREVMGIQNLMAVSFLKKIERNYSKWTIVTEIYREDGELSCIVNAEGAWIDLSLRKVASLPEELREQFEQLPKADDFVNL